MSINWFISTKFPFPFFSLIVLLLHNYANMDMNANSTIISSWPLLTLQHEHNELCRQWIAPPNLLCTTIRSIKMQDEWMNQMNSGSDRSTKKCLRLDWITIHLSNRKLHQKSFSRIREALAVSMSDVRSIVQISSLNNGRMGRSYSMRLCAWTQYGLIELKWLYVYCMVLSTNSEHKRK